MPRYFFNLPDHSSHDLSRDHAREYPDLRAALAEAHHAARSILHTHVRRGAVDLRGRLDIEDERHQPVARILFADVARQIT
jgi:hypothetical protein